MVRKVVEQKKAKKLRANGRSIAQISKQLNVVKSSVSIWVRDVSLTKKQKEHLIKMEARGAAKGRMIIIKRWIEYRKQYPKPGPDLELQKNLAQIEEFINK